MLAAAGSPPLDAALLPLSLAVSLARPQVSAADQRTRPSPRSCVDGPDACAPARRPVDAGGCRPTAWLAPPCAHCGGWSATSDLAHGAVADARGAVRRAPRQPCARPPSPRRVARDEPTARAQRRDGVRPALAPGPPTSRAGVPVTAPSGSARGPVAGDMKGPPRAVCPRRPWWLDSAVGGLVGATLLVRGVARHLVGFLMKLVARVLDGVLERSPTPATLSPSDSSPSSLRPASFRSAPVSRTVRLRSSHFLLPRGRRRAHLEPSHRGCSTPRASGPLSCNAIAAARPHPSRR